MGLSDITGAILDLPWVFLHLNEGSIVARLQVTCARSSMPLFPLTPCSEHAQCSPTSAQTLFTVCPSSSCCLLATFSSSWSRFN